MPQDNDIVATASNSGTVYLYKLTDPFEEPDNELSYYEKLEFHTENGYGLAWNPSVKGSLLTSTDDSKVALWDINSPSSPKSTYTDSSDIVNDVAWHQIAPTNFGSASEDKNFYYYDTRSSSEPILKYEIHEEPINTLAFSGEHVLATGSTDKNVVLSDLRYLKRRLHTLVGHGGPVSTLQWAPFDTQGRILASSGSDDRRVIVWDISRIGEEQSQEDAEDGAPELIFMHGGHTSSISDFSWGPANGAQWLAGTVSEDNIVQIWQPALASLGIANVEIDENDLE